MSLREIVEVWATECDIELTNGEVSQLIKLVEENGSSHNSESAPCEVAASCPVHRCRECRRYYDDMYQLT